MGWNKTECVSLIVPRGPECLGGSTALSEKCCLSRGITRSLHAPCLEQHARGCGAPVEALREEHLRWVHTIP